MPLIIDGGRVPTRWAEKKGSTSRILIDSYVARARCVTVALINNMPDPALEDTEIQFFDLLDAVAGDIPVRLKLYSLPKIPRSDRGQQHLSSFYFDIEDLWNSPFDGVIMTGTEPRQPDLRDETYWSALVAVLDWAEQNTASTVLSCLAAHAGVLYSDGVERHRLSDKHLGVFEYRRVSDHPLTSHSPKLVRFPHSRWNEVREDALASCGYDVLTKSGKYGVDSFVKKKKRSLFVHFQGHPEYGAATLLKEYRRDIKRFFAHERETYPSMPRGYFDPPATRLLVEFQEKALSQPSEELLSTFPDASLARTIENTWHSSATCLYSNWLQYLASRKAESPVFAVTRVGSTRSTRANNEVA